MINKKTDKNRVCVEFELKWEVRSLEFQFFSTQNG